MNESYLTSIVEERWNEAVANPSVARWKTLAELAAQIADSFAQHDPDNIMAAAHHGIYVKAYERMLAMVNEENMGEHRNK